MNLFGQVSNNSIHRRSELVLNVPTHSSTDNNTVEWDCIDKTLTQKCLVYHNDQWFHFTPQQAGKLYLNLSSQICRDLRGVQLILIEGNPCEVQTYRILKCIPKIFQDDLFLELDSLKAKTLYLINIDGYLGDFCEFDIELSQTPRGLPTLKPLSKLVNLKASDEDKAVVLNWYASRSQLDSIDVFEIYRRKKNDPKSTWLGKILPYSNTLGSKNENYTYADTLYKDGEYRYSIVGVDRTTQQRALLDEVNIVFNPLREFTANIQLDFQKRGKLFISVVDPEKNYQTLNVFEYAYEIPVTVPISLSPYAQRGLKRFWIRVKHERTNETKLFGYFIDEKNQLHEAD